MKRVLSLLQQHWPLTHIVLRWDGHFTSTDLMELIVADGNTDFIFGLDRMGSKDCAIYIQSLVATYDRPNHIANLSMNR